MYCNASLLTYLIACLRQLARLAVEPMGWFVLARNAILTDIRLAWSAKVRVVVTRER